MDAFKLMTRCDEDYKKYPFLNVTGKTLEMTWFYGFLIFYFCLLKHKYSNFKVILNFPKISRKILDLVLQLVLICYYAV